MKFGGRSKTITKKKPKKKKRRFREEDDIRQWRNSHLCDRIEEALKSLEDMQKMRMRKSGNK